MSTRRRTLGIYASPTPKGPNGERLCRNCQKVLEKGQRHNCSPKCSDEWMCKTSPNHLRYRLFERDHGVCALCSLNTGDLSAAIEWVNRRCRKGHFSFSNQEKTSVRQWSSEEWYGFLKALQVGHRWPGDIWDADHIVPVIEGGGECGLDNFRTLCIPCHKKETRELRARMAKTRREKLAQMSLEGI